MKYNSVINDIERYLSNKQSKNKKSLVKLL